MPVERLNGSCTTGTGAPQEYTIRFVFVFLLKDASFLAWAMNAL